jgi:membrane dipeptidase
MTGFERPTYDVIDGHNDLPWAMREHCGYDFTKGDLANGIPELQTDILRLRGGEVTGQFWSVYVPSRLQGTKAVTATLEQIDFVYRMIDRYPNDFALALSADDVDEARKVGKIASLIGMEGGHSIDESLGVLRMMYDLGARYMTLTHNDNVPWADSATDVPTLGGMNSFGHGVIQEMNRIGMIVDLSHVSADVMRQAIATTKAPVMFSHSSARALCNVPRNVPDDVLATLTNNGGLCMVTFVPDFISPAVAEWADECKQITRDRGGDPKNFSDVDAVCLERKDSMPRATIDEVCAHIEHVRNVAGIDHVGIGGDYDGTMFMPAGLEDVSGYPRLFDALADRGWSRGELDKLCRTNVLRVLRSAEDVASR